MTASLLYFYELRPPDIFVYYVFRRSCFYKELIKIILFGHPDDPSVFLFKRFVCSSLNTYY